jgi:hypothetical protein
MKITKLILTVFLLLFPALPLVAAEVDCQINSGPCVKQIPLDNIQVVFDINPKPVKFMEELAFTITLTQGKKPITDAKIQMELGMPGMFMGKNTPAIKHVKDGIYEGKGVIPRCPSGKKVWRALLTIERDNKIAHVEFTFEGR